MPLGSGVRVPGSLLLRGGGLAASSGFKCGWGVGGLHVGPLPILAACLHMPHAGGTHGRGERAAQPLTSARAWQEPGSTDQEPVLPGHKAGCPQPMGLCLPVPVMGVKTARPQ